MTHLLAEAIQLGDGRFLASDQWGDPADHLWRAKTAPDPAFPQVRGRSRVLRHLRCRSSD